LFLNPLTAFTRAAENTKASFIEACKAGADGIETGKSKCHEDLKIIFSHTLIYTCILLTRYQISTLPKTMSLFYSMIQSWEGLLLDLERSMNSLGPVFLSKYKTSVSEGKLNFRHVRTKQQPIQPIPKFTEVLDLLVAPGHENVKLNVSSILRSPDRSEADDRSTAKSRMNLPSCSHS
jgi:hypothetical protein